MQAPPGVQTLAFSEQSCYNTLANFRLCEEEIWLKHCLKTASHF